MSPRSIPQLAQLGFNGLLMEAEETNRALKLARELKHLPGTYAEGVPFYRGLLEAHHAAMLAGDAPQAFALRTEAARLARKLNHGDPGIIAGDDSPGTLLARGTRAEAGCVPLWGQRGSFEITACGMRVRIAMEGMFGIASDICEWLGFAAHVVARDRPFLSETGYRSFIAPNGELQPGFTPESFTAEVIAAYVRHSLRGRLLGLAPEYRRKRRRGP